MYNEWFSSTIGYILRLYVVDGDEIEYGGTNGPHCETSCVIANAID